MQPTSDPSPFPASRSSHANGRDASVPVVRAARTVAITARRRDAAAEPSTAASRRLHSHFVRFGRDCTRVNPAGIVAR